ncbi:hypothetical protein [Ochrobactrum chromiisoli]|uniref:Uncharacterized protein n=1 Tax=Ochrobactrum chromiisoli TaxID=2993941 RepID=A0ABT3QKW6_9HYPH|nr:hypothetical protein [Ochrobactrum chromiisoli]MCX2696259.1 hypothetical protein [Ochrobactrum chromiisoli]
MSKIDNEVWNSYAKKLVEAHGFTIEKYYEDGVTPIRYLSKKVGVSIGEASKYVYGYSIIIEEDFIMAGTYVDKDYVVDQDIHKFNFENEKGILNFEYIMNLVLEDPEIFATTTIFEMVGEVQDDWYD